MARRLPLRLRDRPRPGAAGARLRDQPVRCCDAVPFVLTLAVLAGAGQAHALARRPAELKGCSRTPHRRRRPRRATSPSPHTPIARPPRPRLRSWNSGLGAVLNTKGNLHAHPATYPFGRRIGSRALSAPGPWRAAPRPRSPRSRPRTHSAGKDTGAVGFIMVGPKDDFGYNQAVYEGSEVIKDAFPDLEILTAENVPEDDTAATTMEQMIDKGAKLDLRHQLRPPRRRPARWPRSTRTSSSSSRATPSPTRHPDQLRHLLRHRLRADVPRRHRRGRGDRVRQARLRLRLPDPADDRQHQRLRARRPVGQPRRRDHHRRARRRWCDPGKQQASRREPALARASTSSPSTRTAPRPSSRPPRRRAR